MPQKRILKIVLCILTGIFFVLGIPILINSAYEYGTNHTPIVITLWRAETVLSYYGSVLGATITGASLCFTIHFTRKQIQRESYLKNETEKWAKIEDTIGSILDEINPIPILKQDIDIGGTDPNKAINLFQKYQMNCRIVTDQLMTCVNATDSKKISKLVKRIIDVADKLFHASKEKVNQHMQQQQLEQRELVSALLFMEKQSPGVLPADKISEYQNIVKETDTVHQEDITDAMRPIIEEFIHIYETEFRPLLQLKCETFEGIYKQIQKNADAILPVEGK